MLAAFPETIQLLHWFAPRALHLCQLEQAQRIIHVQMAECSFIKIANKNSKKKHKNKSGKSESEH